MAPQGFPTDLSVPEPSTPGLPGGVIAGIVIAVIFNIVFWTCIIVLACRCVNSHTDHPNRSQRPPNYTYNYKDVNANTPIDKMGTSPYTKPELSTPPIADPPPGDTNKNTSRGALSKKSSTKVDGVETAKANPIEIGKKDDSELDAVANAKPVEIGTNKIDPDVIEESALVAHSPSRSLATGIAPREASSAEVHVFELDPTCIEQSKVEALQRDANLAPFPSSPAPSATTLVGTREDAAINTALKRIREEKIALQRMMELNQQEELLLMQKNGGELSTA